MKFLRRRRWPLVEGRLIDKRHIRVFLARFESSIARVSVDEYLVEFPRPDGSTGRAAIKEKSVHMPIPPPHVGDTVPVHVNRSGTRAVFGRFEPRVSRAERRRREKERRARDKARFEEKLRER